MVPNNGYLVLHVSEFELSRYNYIANSLLFCFRLAKLICDSDINLFTTYSLKQLFLYAMQY